MIHRFSRNDILRLDIIRRASMPAAVAAAVLLVGGCGGAVSEAPKAGPPTSTGSPTAAGVVLNVTGSEYSFAPSALKASAGPTTIRFTNGGAMEHDLVIDALNVHLNAKPGETAEATVTLRPGTYEAYCSIPGHSQSGMQGKLTVS